MADALSFAKDIRPLFSDTDVAHMAAMMDLSSRDEAAEHAAAISSVVREGSMPPGGPRWTDAMCDAFDEWVKQGCPP